MIRKGIALVSFSAVVLLLGGCNRLRTSPYLGNRTPSNDQAGKSSIPGAGSNTPGGGAGGTTEGGETRPITGKEAGTGKTTGTGATGSGTGDGTGSGAKTGVPSRPAKSQ